MISKLEAYVLAACGIADQLHGQSEAVPIAWLKRSLPRGVWIEEGNSLRAMELVLDAVGIALEQTPAKYVILRWCSRDTGTLDQAVRIRDAFRERLFGPKETLTKQTLAQLGSWSKAATSNRGEALAESLEAVGFKSLGDWETKWNRNRLIVPDEGIKLQLRPATLRLAKLRTVSPYRRASGDGLLAQHFPDFAGYTCPAQRNAVHAILNANGSQILIARLPTGSGKSLLYLLPCAEWRMRGEPSTAVIVSPVIALQNDQIRKIRNDYHFTGLQAAELNSTVAPAQRTEIYRKLRDGKLDALFLAPEKLVDPLFQQILIDSAQHIRLFVVDEAHMIADWGQDFRTDFFRLGVVRNRLQQQNPQIQTLLLSATLTDDNERIVLQVFRNPEVVVRIEEPSIRSELSIRVIRHHWNADVDETLRDLIRQVPRPCIIYCARREHVKELRSLMRQAGVRRFMDYMGSTPPDSRRERLNAFHQGDVDFVIATNAFGLGVDKADVRSIIHYDVPSSLDEYYQQIGRAARDHQTGHAFLLYSPASMRRATRDKKAIIRTETAAARAQVMLAKRFELPGDGPGACLLPLHALPEHVKQASTLNRNWNFAVLNILEQLASVDVDRAVLRHVWVRKGAKPHRIAEYPLLAEALKVAIRPKNGGIVDLAAFAARRRMSFSRLEQDLVASVLDRAIELMRDVEVSEHEREEWVLARRSGSRTWSPQHTLRLQEHRKERLKIAEKQRKQLKAFVAGKVCRLLVLQKVYGHELGEPCGHCDVCDTRLRMQSGQPPT